MTWSYRGCLRAPYAFMGARVLPLQVLSSADYLRGNEQIEQFEDLTISLRLR